MILSHVRCEVYNDVKENIMLSLLGECVVWVSCERDDFDYIDQSYLSGENQMRFIWFCLECEKEHDISGH